MTLINLSELTGNNEDVLHWVNTTQISCFGPMRGEPSKTIIIMSDCSKITCDKTSKEVKVAIRRADRYM